MTESSAPAPPQSLLHHWEDMVEVALQRLSEEPAGRELLAELFCTAATDLTQADAVGRRITRALSAEPHAWSAALDAEQARGLRASLREVGLGPAEGSGPAVAGWRGRPGPGVAGHIRVVTLADDGARVRSLFVRCERANTDFQGRRRALRGLFPSIGNIAEALQELQTQVAVKRRTRALLPHPLLGELEGWIQSPDLALPHLLPLRELLVQVARLAPSGSFEIRHACLDAPVGVGREQSGHDARSVELAMVLAAMSDGFLAPAATNVVVATGGVHPVDLGVSPVSHLVEKAEGVQRWAQTRRDVRGGLFLYPQAAHDALDGEELVRFESTRRGLLELGMACRGVRHVWEAWGAIPRRPPRLAAGGELLIGVAIGLWYFERVVVGEYAGDPLTVARLGWGRVLSLSGVVAIAMGALFVTDFVRGAKVQSAWGRRLLAFTYFPASALAVLFLKATGVLDFPPESPALKNPDAVTRVAWIWKDLGIVYPFVVFFFALIWRSLRARYVADRLERAGLLFAAREALNPPHHWFERFLVRGYPFLGGIFMTTMLILMGYDFFWYAQKPEKNWSMLAHIAFQTFWGLLWFGIAPYLLNRQDARATPLAEE